MRTLVGDLRYGLRMLRKNRGMTLVAVIALALGIGSNTAIFSVIHAVLLRPLPYNDPDRLVTLLHQDSNPVSPADFLDWPQQNHSFSDMAAAEAWFATIKGSDKPEQLLGLRLTDSMFALLGVMPLRGRSFLPEDSQPGREHVLVLSYGLWQRRFGGRTDILGQNLLLDGDVYTVIGIMRPQFHFAPFWVTQAEMWAPLPLANRSTNRAGRSLRVFARLKPGVTQPQGQAEMNSISRRLEAAYPDSNTGLNIRVELLHEKVVGNIRPALLVLAGAVGFVLLIACANIANLSLARAAARRKEIAVRISLGAKRLRIVRQLLTESVLTALLGGGFGLLLAFWGTRLLRSIIQAETGSFASRMPRWYDIGINFPVLFFTLSLSVLTGFIFGLIPALEASKPDLNQSLKEGRRGSTGAPGSWRTRNALVVSEIAIALIVLIGAGLMMRSFLRLRTIDPGFDPHNLLTMTVSVAGEPQYRGLQREMLYRQLTRNIQSLPGVQSVGVVNHLPLGGDLWGTNIAIEGRPIPPPGDKIHTVYRICLPNYFQTMSIPLLKGRDFTDRDRTGTPGVVIINDKLARRYWQGADPLGKRLTMDDPEQNPAWLTVVGVVSNVKQFEWAGEPGNEIYLPFLQNRMFLESPHPWAAYMTLVVHGASAPAAMAQAVQSAIWAVDKNLPISRIHSMEEVIANSVWQPRFQLLLITIFAAVALVLTAVGIYGVIAYSVTQRTHEIGIRMALGARRSGILGRVLRQSLTFVLVGIALGIGAAIAVTRLMTSLLYGVTATDPATFAAVSAVVFGVALLAAFMPARRAARIDPMVALRYE